MKKKDKFDYGAFLAAFESSINCDITGKLVRSKSGHDKGKFYLVVAAAGDMLFLVDGRKRTIANPKKKNIRHVQLVHSVAADIMNKKNKELPSDLQIRAAIAKMTKEG